jgi:hypothetical protein
LLKEADKELPGDPMTRLDEIRERLEKATKGEWQRRNDILAYCFIMAGDQKILGDATVAYPSRQRGADADYIAHSKADIAFLLSEIERKDGALKAGRDRCSVCDGGGSVVDKDNCWRDCEGCSVFRAALRDGEVR